jgi:RNase P/RNase MRP subunit p29
MRIIALFFAVVLTAPLAARAEANPQRVNVSGTVVSSTASAIVVETSSGRTTVSLNSKSRFFVVSKSSLNNVTEGSFIGTAVAPGSDGTFTSTEVHIFAPALKGTGEGFTQMGGSGNHMMANATVHTVAAPNMMANSTVRTVGAAGGGKTITMTFPSGTKTIHIPANVPVTYIEPGTPAMHAKGVHVRVVALENGNVLTAEFVEVGKNGIAPPP